MLCFEHFEEKFKKNITRYEEKHFTEIMQWIKKEIILFSEWKHEKTMKEQILLEWRIKLKKYLMVILTNPSTVLALKWTYARLKNQKNYNKIQWSMNLHM